MSVTNPSKPTGDNPPAAKPAFFKNAEVNAKYLAPFGVDSIIHIPKKYSGPLSGISLEVAALLVQMKDNQVKEK